MDRAAGSGRSRYLQPNTALPGLQRPAGGAGSQPQPGAIRGVPLQQYEPTMEEEEEERGRAAAHDRQARYHEELTRELSVRVRGWGEGGLVGVYKWAAHRAAPLLVGVGG